MKIICILKLILTITTLLLMSLVVIKLYSIFLGTTMHVNTIYSITGLYVVIFIYSLFKKAPSFFSNYKESYLLLDTFLRLNRTNPFYSTLYCRLKPFYKLYLKELLYEGAKLFVFAGIFFVSDSIYRKNSSEFLTTTMRKTSEQSSITNILPSDNTSSIQSEVKRLEKIKNIIKNPALKRGNIINEIMKLKTVEQNNKIKLAGKVIDKNIKEIVKDLIGYTKNIKQKLQGKSDAGISTDALEKELIYMYKKLENKKNKKYKVSVRYLNDWYGYEDVLRKYFK